MKETILDVAVIGGGHAGLAISYYLKQHSLNHLVFERGRTGEVWRSQRWDSFAMNTANHKNVLPGQVYSGDDPEGFCTAKDFVSALEAYKNKFQLPVIEHAQVTAVKKEDGDQCFIVSVSEHGTEKKYRCKQVVIASGSQNEKKLPGFAGKIPSGILQLHTTEYRDASQLPQGAILVTGSAQSGGQIAEDLAENGRKVFLSTSMVARIPRRYRGKDIVDWLTKMNFFDLKTEMVTDPNVFAMKVPLLSGVGRFGHTLSYQLLAKKGVTILGKMENADENNGWFAGNATDHIKFADGFSQKVKAMVDDFIVKNQLSPPQPEEDIADIPDQAASCASQLTSLNFNEHNIKTIIWATGFKGDFSYLKVPVIDSDGNPKHKNGLSDIKGLYFLGLPWLRMRKSSMIFGISEDAAYISEALLNEKLTELNDAGYSQH